MLRAYTFGTWQPGLRFTVVAPDFPTACVNARQALLNSTNRWKVPTYDQIEPPREIDTVGARALADRSTEGL